MKRTFIAVPISDEVRLMMKKIIDEIPKLRENLRIVTPENAHITLKFLGNTKEISIPNIVSVLKSAASLWSPFQMTIEGCGVFPTIRRPRVLWLGVVDGIERMRELSATINEILSEEGFEKEKRDFTSHITLGRVRNERRSIDGLERFLAYRFEPIKTVVDRVIYFESKLTLKGPVYEPIEMIKFKK